MNPRLSLLIALAVGASTASAAEPTTPPPATTPVPTAPAPTAPAPTSRQDKRSERRDRGDRSSNNSSSSSAATATKSAPSVTPSLSLDSFRLISDRNIFNSQRTGRRDRTDDPGPRLDTISLVGTMDSDRGLRAFFDGSTSSYRKALRVGDSVDKFKVTQISPNVVDLDYEGKAMSMRVGQQLRRPDGATEWNMVSADVVRAEAAAAAAKANEGKVDPTAPVAIPTNADEVTRRLMERRNKDLKK